MTELDRIRGHEEEARARIDQVGQQARAASAELAAARERLVEFERAGAGRPADRRRLEEALAAAEARAAGSSSVRRPQAGSTSGTGGCISMNACYTPQQLEVAYGFQPLLQRGIDGRGETVVLPELAQVGYLWR